ncbi:reverse transcriptase domain-containing protein [Mesorhizobium sp. M0676]
MLNLWAHQWRRRHAHGCVVIVRYADDFVMGFEKKADAEEILLVLKARLAGFGLTLQEDKTRLIELGGSRPSHDSGVASGGPRPSPFWASPTTGADPGWPVIVKHNTEGKRLTRKLRALRQDTWWLCTRQWLHSTGGSLPFCADTKATTAGRTTTQRSTDSIGKCAGYGYGLRRRSQTSRRMGWSEFETLTARFPANYAHHSNLGASTDMTRATLGNSRVRDCEGRKPNG